MDVINLNKYISISYSGYDKFGQANVIFDRETFLLDNINNIVFKPDTEQVFREVYGNTNQSAASTILMFISAELSNNSALCNGDVLNVIWNINADTINKYFVVNYSYSTESFTVTGLLEASTFDPFDNIVITCFGSATRATASVYYNGEQKHAGSYVVVPDHNLNNGDIVTVKYISSDEISMIEYYGEYPSSYEKEYTINGLITLEEPIDKKNIIYEIDFTDPSNQYFKNFNSIDKNTVIENGIFKANITGGDPFMSYIDGSMNLKCDEIQFIHFHIKVAAADASMQLFFTTDSVDGYNEQASMKASATPNSTEIEIIEFDTSQSPYWSGTLNGFRFDPSNADKGSFEIDSIQFIGNFN